MTLLNSRRIRALILGLAAASAPAFAPAARADAINYGSIGSIDTPAGSTANVVYYDGINNGQVPDSGQINLGSFVVSSLAKTGSQDYNYTNDPFHIIVYSGGDQSVRLDGVINGSVGPDVTNPALTATINTVSPYGNNPLPFNLSVPLNTPLNLAITDGVSPAPTMFAVAASPVPEPASIAVFAVALGGLVVWRRRAGVAAAV